MFITVDIIDYVLNSWKESDEYTKCCFLNIKNYKKIFNKQAFSSLYDGCVSKVIIEFIDDKLYKVDIYADSIYLIYLDSEEKIIEKLGNEFIYKIHIISDIENYVLYYPLPLSKYDVKVNLSGKISCPRLKIYSLAELRKVNNKNYGLKDVDLFVFISNSKNLYKILDTLLFIRYIKPDIVEYQEVFFDFKPYNNVKEMKSFINYIDKLMTKYSQESLNKNLLNKVDIKNMSKTFLWYLDISWFSNSSEPIVSQMNVTNIDLDIIEILASVKNKYGRIGILNEN